MHCELIHYEHKIKYKHNLKSKIKKPLHLLQIKHSPKYKHSLKLKINKKNTLFITNST